ncbi:helicase-related protein [Nocardia vulneris]|uniref:Helicase n=1 Tax=Nocardia vulneris TaxID=1141657 RepID=A0ABR4Z5S3_9NOCA|nr:helicase-related protein [Nocardia vulneris]KIA60653.1 helicase [Nocardia vulneris]
MIESMSATLNEKYRFRREMVEELARDVFGPAPDDTANIGEILEEAPLDRYVVGVLWPADDELQEVPEPDGVEPADKDPFDDTPVVQARMRYPSSMGLTFSVRTSVSSAIAISARAAHYVALDVPDGATAGARSARTGKWERVPLELITVTQKLSPAGTYSEEIEPGLELHRYVRPERDGVVTVTVTLRNKQPTPKGELRDSKAWFQVGLTITTPEPAITDRTQHRNIGHDDDLDSAALLYRAMHTFAVGHGCAAYWERSTTVDNMTATVSTTFLPTHEIPRARPGGLDDAIDLRMETLATASDEVISANLWALTSAYRVWINELEAKVAGGDAGIAAELLPTAARHIDDARKAAARIERGIALLEHDPDSMLAFRLANRAMQLQRARQEWIRAGATGQLGSGEDQRWYPFQIAYILLNLPALSDRRHPDRDIADLLWFPTGGGKTEAYLGLIAFSIMYRRLKNREAVGVAVIMRYTLRLLTIQQFERASMLICALETVRRSDVTRLGDRCLSIGLWVGSGGTPNTLDEAQRAIRELRDNREIAEKNPRQLTQCPWCGEPLEATNYAVVRKPERHLRIACENPSCEFADGLPVHVVDEDIYNARPELVLGTVDKFAMMAWKADVGKLFARDDDKSAPPDLIIQDELHLISGPLGSMVGLYETAIDAACSVRSLADGSTYGRPKVIASTATIRRAQKQIEAVFARSAAQFPPPGIDPDRSFFAEPAPAEVLGTREYVGIMAPGASHATLLVRVYTALLQAAADIVGDDQTRDPYWTLLGYFNSLRVLGSANLQVEGDVRERLDLVANRKHTKARGLSPLNELTSRVASSEIPERLKQIEKTLKDGSPNDVVLATNMISVGVDIDRLGLMAVMGQPQSNAEYIQATSRVGRRHPGLVVAIFNSARSRDRSHYENFIPYHQALYRAVEATSATPFAARARDRGLHGVLVSLARLLVPQLTADNAASLAEDYWDELQEVARIVRRRVAGVDPEESEATGKEIDQLLGVWADEGAAKPNMRYGNSNTDAALLVEPSTALVDEAIDYSQKHAPWPTLQSMRDVDAESGLYPYALRRNS